MELTGVLMVTTSEDGMIHISHGPQEEVIITPDQVHGLITILKATVEYHEDTEAEFDSYE
jgi:hypothetical protein